MESNLDSLDCSLDLLVNRMGWWESMTGLLGNRMGLLGCKMEMWDCRMVRLASMKGWLDCSLD